jgi:hypothetical protein
VAQGQGDAEGGGGADQRGAAHLHVADRGGGGVEAVEAHEGFAPGQPGLVEDDDLVAVAAQGGAGVGHGRVLSGGGRDCSGWEARAVLPAGRAGRHLTESAGHFGVFAMPHFPAPIVSRLPAVGTTIFTIMSRLAQECGAINLSQGFPDFSAEDVLFERVAHWMRAGHNQYAPMAGCRPCGRRSRPRWRPYGAAYDPEHEVTVTAGATQALFTAVAALVHPGDEVIVFEPV